MAASASGILKKITATRMAVSAPEIAHRCGLTLRPASSPKRTRMGRAATRVESHQGPKGSYTWVQCMFPCFLAREPRPETGRAPVRNSNLPSGKERRQDRAPLGAGHYARTPEISLGGWEQGLGG